MEFYITIENNDNLTPGDIVDEDGGINGVGAFFRSDNSICTGTLINPRTVLFAAHCVNSNPESDFQTGVGISSAFAFGVDALPGLQDWFASGFVSNPDLFVYNVSQIQYNPDSLTNPGAFGFLEGDIALATLDTPAANIPTWALLFSRLPDPAELDSVTGTGYHVDITGYGRSGSGTLGDFQGVDFRRRAAENMLGALTSFDDRNTFLFGAPFGDLPQNLYRIDFDDPNQTNPFDFNLYLDEPLENEGTTAGGDSGGPLILDAENNAITDEDLVIGVLSGGSRFFGAQGFSSFGTESFYQPLYLFSDYIAAANPYRYVSAIAGDGDWEDASHWQTDLDPNYRIIDADGNIVNGFPDEQSFGIEDDGDPGFGAVCFDLQGDNPGDECQDFSTGDPVDPARNVADTTGNNVGQLTDDQLNALGLSSDNDAQAAGDEQAVSVRGGALSGAGGVLVGGQSQAQNGVEFAEETPQSVDFTEEEAQVGGDPLPNPTIENGLAGATDFVPDNIDPAPGAFLRRYFDVTLDNEGTTTLSSTRIIDRLTVAGQAGLIIGADGNLTSLIDISQFGGRVAVDGSLNSVGDYTIFDGMLSGSGTITTPFLTNIAGAIAPGAIGMVDTLALDGSAVLSSGSTFFVDIGADRVSDLFTITGDSSLGGTVVFSPTADVRAGNTYTILTTGGTQSGEFSPSSNISVILQPLLTHNQNSVDVEIVAGSYQDAVNPNAPVQVSYASLLDGSRGSSGLDSIFATLDLASAEDIQAVLDSWAPVNETSVRSLAKANTETLSRFHRNRLSNMNSSNWGGSVTVMGKPLQLASNSQFASQMSDIGSLQVANGAEVTTSNSIPDDFAVYLAGTYIDGSGAAMPTIQDFGNEDFDGWSVTGGIEHYVSEKVSVGASLTYSQIEVDEGALLSNTDSDYIAGTVYGQLRSSTGVVLDGFATVGSYSVDTSRTVAFPEVSELTSEDSSFTFTGDIQVSKDFDVSNFVVRPKASLRTTVVDFDDVVEEGGVPALNIQRDRFNSTQARFVADLETSASDNTTLRLSGEYVREFETNEESFLAGFALAPASVTAPFALFGTDKDWFEVGGNLSFNTGATRIDLSVESTVGRNDIEAQTYRAGVTFDF